MSKPVALITGVGPGTGAALVRRFSTGGYAVAMLARNAERLHALEQSQPGCHAFAVDVSDSAALDAAVTAVNGRLGAPSVVVHNAVGGAFGSFQDIDPEVLRRNFEVNVMAMLNLARAVTPAMITAGSGAFVATGNTSALRGRANFAGFAPTKAAQRILAEAMARDLGPKGVHVAYVVIDAVIDVPWTRARYDSAPDEFFIAPDHIADEVWHVAHQPRSAWSFNVELRPFGETW